MTRCKVLETGLVAIIAAVSCSGYSEQSAPTNQTIEQASALEKMEVAFLNRPSREAIKEKLDKAMALYGAPRTEENYERAASALIVLRKEHGFAEMDILDYMIRSHVEGVNIDFPSAAGISAVMLASGDR